MATRLLRKATNAEQVAKMEINTILFLSIFNVSHLGEWLWLDNTAVNFVNWNVGEPSPQQNEHCVEMYANSGYWNNNYCSSYKGYICKKPKSKCYIYNFVWCFEYSCVLVDGFYTQWTSAGCFVLLQMPKEVHLHTNRKKG